MVQLSLVTWVNGLKIKWFLQVLLAQIVKILNSLLALKARLNHWDELQVSFLNVLKEVINTPRCSYDNEKNKAKATQNYAYTKRIKFAIKGFNSEAYIGY